MLEKVPQFCCSSGAALRDARVGSSPRTPEDLHKQMQRLVKLLHLSQTVFVSQAA